MAMFKKMLDETLGTKISKPKEKIMVNLGKSPELSQSSGIKVIQVQIVSHTPRTFSQFNQPLSKVF